MWNPKISIVMSTFNDSKFIWETIESVINQDFKDFEFIIINDCSTDNTLNIIKQYINKDKRIYLINNKSNLWLTKNLNKWIKISKWKYVARIDSDDIWFNTSKLKQQFNFMEKNIDYWICGTWVIFIDEDWRELDKIINRETDQEIRNNISWSNQFAHPSVIIRKNILDKVWLYNENIKVAQDYDLWLRVWTISKFYNLKSYLLKYRIRKWSISWKKRYKQKISALKSFIKYWKHYPNKITWLIKHIINLILPRIIIKYLIKVKNIKTN